MRRYSRWHSSLAHPKFISVPLIVSVQFWVFKSFLARKFHIISVMSFHAPVNLYVEHLEAILGKCLFHRPITSQVPAVVRQASQCHTVLYLKKRREAEENAEQERVERQHLSDQRLVADIVALLPAGDRGPAARCDKRYSLSKQANPARNANANEITK
jgi:hypothetical protein